MLFEEKHEFREGSSHVDLAKAQRGGLKVQVFAVWVDPVFSPHRDGIPTTPTDLSDASSYPALVTGLEARGFREDEIRRIMGGNLLQFMERFETRHACPPDDPDGDRRETAG